MKTLLRVLSLLAILLTGCAPAATSTQLPEMASATPILEEPTETPIAALTATPLPTERLNAAPAPTVQAVATSRGPNLEATDPKTVSMASGGLQFVEFFEFW